MYTNLNVRTALFWIWLYSFFLFEILISGIRNDETNQCSLLFFFRRCAFKWFLLGDYWSRAPSRAVSVPPSPPPLRAFSVPPRDFRASSVPRFDPLSPLDLLSEYEREPFQRGLSPTPVKAHRWAPRCSEVAFDTDGNLIFALLSSIQFFVWHIFFVCYWKSTFTQQNRIHESNIKEGFFTFLFSSSIRFCLENFWILQLPSVCWFIRILYYTS